MSGPGLDLEKPNAIGGLDRLVTNFALSAIAVFPTFATCIVMPSRLRPLIDQDVPDGRQGMLLAPGAFFPFALMVSFIAAAILATPETLDYNGAYIGPGLATAVQSAASEGDIWKLIATVMPIYGTAVIIGILGIVLKPWAGQGWTLRASLRAAFYIFGVLVSWLILTTAVIDLIRLSTSDNEIASMLYKILIIPTSGVFIWMYYGIFRNSGAVSKVRSSALAMAMIGLILVLIVGIDLLIRL